MHFVIVHESKISIYLRAFPTDSSNFCTVWRMNSDFYLYLPTFSNTHFNRFSISFSISFKYYFFHSLFILFLTTTHLPIFFYTTHHYYNWKNVFEEWTVAHQTWWATVHEPKKNPCLPNLLEHPQCTSFSKL